MLQCRDLSALKLLTASPSGFQRKSAVERKDHVKSIRNKSTLLPVKWATGILYSGGGSRSQPLIVASTVEDGKALHRTVPRSFRGAKSSHSTSDTQTEEIEKKKMVSQKIKGTVVLMKKNVLDFNDFNASVLDRVHELFGKRVSLQLISAVNRDPGKTFFFF